jgi:tRNA U34 5-methylaminomethyl-2-thiouridine-forming methyltransferase MnmC
MDHLEVIATDDGSHSILNTALQETYHSRHGAVQESTHVFIDHGLRVAELTRKESLRILEIGFGTGLNAALTLLEAGRRNLGITYESWEKFPLPAHVIDQLNYGAILGDIESFHALHQAPWNVITTIRPGFELYKRVRDILAEPLEGNFDLIYYDAFAPSKQPEMWTQEILRKVTSALAPGGLLVTYCAKGQVKRDLAALGLTVETLPGPPGKKEMTRATRNL